MVRNVKLAVLLLTLVGSPGRAATLDNPPALQDLSFLVGTWEGPMFGGNFIAEYCPPGKQYMLSYSRLEKDASAKESADEDSADEDSRDEDKSLQFYEFEVFAVRNGELSLTPHPGGKPASRFVMVEIDREQKRAVFQNPENEFPKQIVYRRVSADVLLITLSNPSTESSTVTGKKQIYRLRARQYAGE